MKMKIKEYKKLRDKSDVFMGDSTSDFFHYVIGLTSEAGEVAGLARELFIRCDSIDGERPEDRRFRELLKLELGDLLWYLFGILDVAEIDFHDILKANIDKLKTRYPDKFKEEVDDED